MTRKTEEQRNLEFAENRREKVAPGPFKKVMAIGAVALGTAAGVLGLGKSPEQGQPSDMGAGIGQATGEEFAPQKGGDVITDDQDNQLQIIRDEEGNFVEFRNLETGETSQAEISSNPPVEIQSPFAEGNDGHKSAETERETSEQEQPFITGNDGHKAANIERGANSPKG